MEKATPQRAVRKCEKSIKVVRPLAFEVDDRTLVGALQDDHSWAYEVLYRRYSEEVLSVLYRVLGSDTEMDELLNEVFVRAFRNVDAIHDPDKLRSWLAGIAVFVARGTIRKRRRGRWLQFFDPMVLPEAGSVENGDDARRALSRTYVLLEQLSPDDRIIFALRLIDGRELTEVAEVMGVSLATVKRRLRSAMRRFFAMAKNEPELEEWLNHA